MNRTVSKRCRNYMLLRFRVFGGLVSLSLMLSGCGLLDSKKADYRSVQPSKPLDIPPELSAPAKDDRYTVSEASSKGTTFSSYSADRSSQKATGGAAEVKVVSVLKKNDKLIIERAGNQRWLVMPGTPDVVWPLIRRFVEANSLAIKTESVERGWIETDWAEKPAYVPQDGIRGQLAKALGTLYSTSERSKYRIRLEAGSDKGTTDVFISSRTVEEVYISAQNSETRWQPRPSDPELEAEMLSRLVQFVGLDEKNAVAIVEASNASPSERARFVEKEGKVFVNVEERFDRAWRRVGLALDRNGFTVEDRDRANGFYYVRYNDPLADKQMETTGWFDSLAFWRDKKTSVDQALTTFRVAVVGVNDEMSHVEVQDKSGLPLANATARKILDVVRNELK